LPSLVKYYGKFESFGKEIRWTKFITVERVIFHRTGRRAVETAHKAVTIDPMWL